MDMADMAADDDMVAAAEEAAGSTSADAPAPLTPLLKALRNGADPLNLMSETPVDLDPELDAPDVNPEKAPERAAVAEGSFEDDAADAASGIAQLVTQPGILVEAPALAPFNPFKPKAGSSRTTVPKVHHKLHKLIHKAVIAAAPAAAPLINDAAAVADELAPAIDEPFEGARLALSGAPYSGAAGPAYDPAKLQKQLAKLARTAVTTGLPAEGPVMDDAEALQKEITDDFTNDVQQATASAAGLAPGPAKHATFPKPKIHKKLHKLVHKAVVAAAPGLAPAADAGEALADMLAPAIEEPIAAALAGTNPLRYSLGAPAPATFPKPDNMHKKIHKLIHKAVTSAVPAAAPALDAAAQVTDTWTPALDEPLDAVVGGIMAGLAPAPAPLDDLRKAAKDLRKAIAKAAPAAAPLMAAIGDVVGDEQQDVPADAPGLDALPADIATALGKLTPNARVPTLETAISALGETSGANQATSAVQRAYMDALIKEAREYERAYQNAREALVRPPQAGPVPWCRPVLSVVNANMDWRVSAGAVCLAAEAAAAVCHFPTSFLFGWLCPPDASDALTQYMYNSKIGSHNCWKFTPSN